MKSSRNFLKQVKEFFLSGIFFLCFLSVNWVGPTCMRADRHPQDEIEILALIANHWGANTLLNLHNFDKMGWHVTSAGLTPTVEPCNWFKSHTGVSSYTVDLLIPEITDVTQYDVIAIMSATSSYGKNVYTDLLESEETLNLIRSAVENDLVVWATCGGVRVLAAADVINGRSVVGSQRFQAEYEAAGATYLGGDHPSVIDGPIVTSVRGNYYHHQITQAIAQAIERKSQTQGTFVSGQELEVSTSDLQWADVVWAKAIGTTVADGGRDICVLPSGGFLITGYTWASGNPDLLVLKMTAAGDVVWAKTYGGEGWEYGASICSSGESGFAVAGYSTSFSENDRDIFIMKADAAGNEQWSHIYGDVGLDMASSICTMSSGGYAVCGYTECEGAGEDDVYVIRIDDSGDVIWTKTFGGARADMGSSILETLDGGMIVGAASGSEPYSTKNMDHCLIKLDDEGNEIWWKTFTNDSGEGFDFLYSAIPTADGGYFLTGSSDTTVPMDFMQIKTDSNGNFQWSQTNGGGFYDYGMDLAELQDGYVIAGVTEPADVWNNNILLIRTDLSGNLMWTKNIGGSTQDWLTSICSGGDGDLVVTGHTYSSSSDNWDIFIAKIDVDGSDSPAVTIEMPSDHYSAGDPFYLRVRTWNPFPLAKENIPMFVLLDVAGAYYFWPIWTEAPDWETILLRPGAAEISIIPQFSWPENVGATEGIGIYAAMTNPEMTAVYGVFDHREFGWGN